MSEFILKSRSTQRSDTAENWVSKDPILLKGEIGIEIDTLKFKIGDGATRWALLEYVMTPLSNEEIDNIIK